MIAMQDRLASHDSLVDFIHLIILIAHLYGREKRDRQIETASRHLHNRPRRCDSEICEDCSVETSRYTGVSQPHESMCLIDANEPSPLLRLEQYLTFGHDEVERGKHLVIPELRKYRWCSCDTVDVRGVQKDIRRINPI